jgi:predicted small secreted protein
MHSRRIARIALFLTAAALLSGCETWREATGNGKDTPDEFAVVTKAPLVIPPDFNLKPPAPGAEPTNSVAPTDAAASALFNTDPAVVAASLPATMSDGERYLLAYAHVQDADPAIRQQLAADAGGMRGSDDSFTDNILFWGGPKPPPGATPVDADAEARRVDADRAGAPAPAGTAPAPGSAAPAPQPPSDKDDDGIFDHLWPF